MLNHKEMAKHLRHLIKREGVKARVIMKNACGEDYITVCVPACGVEFTEEEQRKIRFVAKCNKLTKIKGEEIDVERMTDPMQMDFYIGYRSE